MKKFSEAAKDVAMITNTSFTFITLIYTILSVFVKEMPYTDPLIVLVLFAMCFSIALLMKILEKIEDRLNVNSILIDALSRLAIVYLVVFTLGSVVDFIPLTLKGFLYGSMVIIPGFAISYIVIYFTSKKYAQNINDAIKLKKQSKSERQN